ncbi:YbgA family protein [Spongorhabdus nitratireducens]
MTDQNQTNNTSPHKIPVGISSCLLGENVRYNGGHTQSKMCLGILAQHFEYQPFCPEVAAGFGIPRPTMRLTGDPHNPVLQFSDDDKQDLTQQLKDGFHEQLDKYDAVDGYILMKNSPSCGMERIKVYQENGYPHEERTRGLFADALIAAWPMLPIEEEGRLHDPRLRENFVMRVFSHYHFRHEVQEQPTYHNLLQYHSKHKYLLMAHSQKTYKELGRFLAESRQAPLEELMESYFTRFTEAIRKPASRKGHCNVLQHILGHLKRSVSGEARQSILAVIEQYRRGEVNLTTPMTLLAHYVEQTGDEFVQSQRYLLPYPAELGLRNQL